MVVVEGQDALTWHVGFRVLVAKNIYQLKIEPRQRLDSVSVKRSSKNNLLTTFSN